MNCFLCGVELWQEALEYHAFGRSYCTNCFDPAFWDSPGEKPAEAATSSQRRGNPLDN